MRFVLFTDLVHLRMTYEGLSAVRKSTGVHSGRSTRHLLGHDNIRSGANTVSHRLAAFEIPGAFSIHCPEGTLAKPPDEGMVKVKNGW